MRMSYDIFFRLMKGRSSVVIPLTEDVPEVSIFHATWKGHSLNASHTS